jgi:hypothetical protein
LNWCGFCTGGNFTAIFLNQIKNKPVIPFISLIQRERFDYAKWRKSLFEGAMELRKRITS